MLAVVGNQNQAFNNHPIIAKSRFLTYVKLMYYRFVAKAMSVLIFWGMLLDVNSYIASSIR